MLDRLALHAAALKANQAIGHGRERGVVRDDDDRNALLAAGILQQLQDLLAGFIVERARGLVAQKQLGVLCQCAGDGHALLLAARKLCRKVAQALAQANLAKRLFGIERIGANLSCELNVFEGRQVGDQIVELEDKADVARRYSTSCASLAELTSRPSTVTVPEVAVSMPPKMLSAVVLPAPEAPKMMASSPRSTVKLAPSSA